MKYEHRHKTNLQFILRISGKFIFHCKKTQSNRVPEGVIYKDCVREFMILLKMITKTVNRC